MAYTSQNSPAPAPLFRPSSGRTLSKRTIGNAQNLMVQRRKPTATVVSEDRPGDFEDDLYREGEMGGTKNGRREGKRAGTQGEIPGAGPMVETHHRRFLIAPLHPWELQTEVDEADGRRGCHLGSWWPVIDPAAQTKVSPSRLPYPATAKSLVKNVPRYPPQRVLGTLHRPMQKLGRHRASSRLPLLCACAVPASSPLRFLRRSSTGGPRSSAFALFPGTVEGLVVC